MCGVMTHGVIEPGAGGNCAAMPEAINSTAVQLGAMAVVYYGAVPVPAKHINTNINTPK